MAKAQTPVSKRTNQPRCEGCKHPLSFHGGGKTKCRALGCRCLRWTGSKLSAEDQAWVKASVDVVRKAKLLKRSETYVKQHAIELGGRKFDGKWRFPRK